MRHTPSAFAFFTIATQSEKAMSLYFKLNNLCFRDWLNTVQSIVLSDIENTIDNCKNCTISNIEWYNPF